MRRLGGVELAGRDLLLTAWIVRQALPYLLSRDGTLPAGTRELAAQLDAFAGRETVAVVSDEPRETRNEAAAVIVEGSAPAEMTAPAVAALVGISPQAVRGRCRSGKLLSRLDPAGHWRIDVNAAAELAARRKGQA